MAARFIAFFVLILALIAPSASADPTGSDFTIAPNPPNPGEDVTFTFVPGPGVVGDPTVEWDVNGDNAIDQRGLTAQQSYAAVGPMTVTMRVTDANGSLDVPHTFAVTNPPSVDFDFSPANPLPGEAVLFSESHSDQDSDDVGLVWDFGAGATVLPGPSLRVAYSSPGTRTVKLTATDEHGASSVQTRELTVRDPAGPTANFTFSPTVPLVGQAVSFTNTSTPAPGQSLTNAVWDLDNDGEFDDNPAGWSFSTSGNHTVALRVTQTNGNQAVFEKQIRLNAPPAAGFVWNPPSPVAGAAVDLISTATDLEGLGAQLWDLDGDGQFDDASGPTVRHAFPSAGTYAVGQQVTDSDGVTRTMRRALTVAAAVRPAQVEPRFITPFPVVRLAGKVLPHGARIQVLAVQAPRRAVIQVRCVGKGCPIGSVRRTSRGRTVRFPEFERRLRAGIRLKLFMRQPGRIGKYTSFLIRAGSPPKRVDRCLYPTSRAPRRCP